MQGRDDRSPDTAKTRSTPAFELATSLFAARVPASLRLRATSALALLVGDLAAEAAGASWTLEDERLVLRVERCDPAWIDDRATVVALVDHLEVDDLRAIVCFDRHPDHFEEEAPLARLLEADVLGKDDLDELVRVARAGVDLSASPLAATIGRLLAAAHVPVPSES